MIEFKIITCPDKSQQATYQHMASELTIGKSEGDLIIDDPAMGAIQLRVRIEEDKSATLETLNLEVEVRLNGKAISGVVPLKEKDNLTVSRTTINFSRLDTSPLVAPEPFQYPNARERFTPGSKEQTILDALAFLETSVPETSASPPKPPLPPAVSPPSQARSQPPPLPGAGAPPPLPKKN